MRERQWMSVRGGGGGGGGGGIMRLGRDATRGVTATAQEKRGINNGGGA